jgi:hypothetical protein
MDITTNEAPAFDWEKYQEEETQADAVGLKELMDRLKIRFSPNHEAEDGPEVIFDHLYVAPEPKIQPSYRRSGGWKRAELTLVFGEIDSQDPDVPPYCINVPIKVWRYAFSSRGNKSLWKVSDRSTQRIIDMMWENFGYVLY